MLDRTDIADVIASDFYDLLNKWAIFQVSPFSILQQCALIRIWTHDPWHWKRAFLYLARVKGWLRALMAHYEIFLHLYSQGWYLYQCWVNSTSFQMTFRRILSHVTRIKLMTLGIGSEHFYILPSETARAKCWRHALMGYHEIFLHLYSQAWYLYECLVNSTSFQMTF